MLCMGLYYYKKYVKKRKALMEDNKLEKSTKVKIAIISAIAAIIIVTVLILIFVLGKKDSDDSAWNHKKSEYNNMNYSDLYYTVEEGMPACREEAIYLFDQLITRREELVDLFVSETGMRKIEAEKEADESIAYFEQSKAMMEAMTDEMYNTQLTKYVNKSNVSSDRIVCDSIRTSIMTAICDPDVVCDNSYRNPYQIFADNPVSIEELIDSESDTFKKAFLEALGYNDIAELKSKIKTSDTKEIYVRFSSENSLIVYLPGTDLSGEGNKNLVPNKDDNSKSCIYMGPVECFKW